MESLCPALRTKPTVDCIDVVHRFLGRLDGGPERVDFVLGESGDISSITPTFRDGDTRSISMANLCVLKTALQTLNALKGQMVRGYGRDAVKDLLITRSEYAERMRLLPSYGSLDFIGGSAPHFTSMALKLMVDAVDKPDNSLGYYFTRMWGYMMPTGHFFSLSHDSIRELNARNALMADNPSVLSLSGDKRPAEAAAEGPAEKRVRTESAVEAFARASKECVEYDILEGWSSGTTDPRILERVAERVAEQGRLIDARVAAKAVLDNRMVQEGIAIENQYIHRRPRINLCGLSVESVHAKIRAGELAQIKMLLLANESIQYRESFAAFMRSWAAVFPENDNKNGYNKDYYIFTRVRMFLEGRVKCALPHARAGTSERRILDSAARRIYIDIENERALLSMRAAEFAEAGTPMTAGDAATNKFIEEFMKFAPTR